MKYLSHSRTFAKLYSAIYGVASILGIGLGLSFSILKISTVFGAGALLLPYLPLLWINLKDSGTLKKWISVTYLLFLMPVTLVVLFFGQNSIRDFKTGNGLRKVHEGQIEDGRYMAAFRTPDEGALGGDYLVAYVITKICCGMELKKYVGRLSYQKSGMSQATYNGKTYYFPSFEILMERGKLQYDRL